jgi:O-antigen ligase
MILSGTRAAWAGMIAPFFAMFYAYWHKFMRTAVKRFFLTFIIIFILFAISPLINKGLNYLRVGGFQEDFLSRVKSIYDINEISNAGRIAIWKNSTSFAVRHLQGVGLGNFIISQVQDLSKTSNFNDLSSQLNKRYNLPQKYITAHNLYLHILVELGILGLFTFSLFCYKILQKFWQFLKQHKEENGFLIFFVFQSGLVFVWILASAFFDVTLFNDKVLIYFFLTLGVSGVIIKNYQSIK